MVYMYSTFFVILSGSQANALVFGESVLTASTPENAQLDHRLQKFFAILIVAFVCQLQAVSRINFVRFANGFAVYKISLLSFITILGWCALRGERAPAAAKIGGDYGTKNFQNAFRGSTRTLYPIAVAMLDISRIYSGYENANFVRRSFHTNGFRTP